MNNCTSSSIVIASFFNILIIASKLSSYNQNTVNTNLKVGAVRKQSILPVNEIKNTSENKP